MSDKLHSITYPRGFRAASGTCGIKESRKPDLALIACDQTAALAAVFTTNAVVGAPVIVGRRNIAATGGRGRAFVINSGCANVATGLRGVQDALKMCATVGKALGCPANQVLPFSTGVIGKRLPIDRILRGIEMLAGRLERGPRTDGAAARAILTTDLVPKAAQRSVKIGGKTIRIGGFAKGSGMISPRLATMLAFITTDADISAPLLRRVLREAVNADASFNRISVDTDTSTSDTVAVLAGGLAGNKPIRSVGPAYRKFAAAMTDLCRDLAYQVIRDGEGAEHVIHVRVEGAASDEDALACARAVADSPLVKTAVHGADPNWGRIAAAAGRSGVKLDPRKMSIRIGETVVYRRGEPVKFDPDAVSRQIKRPDVAIHISLGLGKGNCTFLGCDLSREYIRINADYTT